jgi:glycosyltransferase involved in cell wall biosynthesis
MAVGVSVIVCCYNSASRLPITLKHLGSQITNPQLEWEVIVVNNNSSDNTAQVAMEVWNKLNTSVILRIEDEPSPGLSAARLKGITSSAFDFIIFCDDDNWLSPSYVETAYTLLSNNSYLAAVGGENVAAFEEEPPYWIGSFKAAYAIGRQGKLDFELLEGDKYLVGAGMAFQKSMFLEILRKGFTFYLTDRIGNKLISGGDVELCYLFKLLGYKIAFSSALVLEHFMPAARINKPYLKRLLNQSTYPSLVFEAYRSLLENSNFRINDANYWKSLATSRIKMHLKFTIRYFYHKLRGNITYYLPLEISIKYNAYLYQNPHKVVSIIKDISRKIEFK